MIKYFCDRCGTELTNRIDYVLFGIKQDGETAFFDDDTKNCHFCQNCAEKIKKYALTAGKSEKTAGKQEKAEVKLEKTETPDAPKNNKKIDTGKIMALRNAGWSAAKIADEMNLTPQQIYSQISYQKKKEAQG